MTYVIYFNINIATPVEMFLLEMQKLIEFKNLNLNSIVQLWEPDFDSTDWMRGYTERIVSEDQHLSIGEKIQISIMACLIFAVFLGAVWILSKKFKKLE